MQDVVMPDEIKIKKLELTLELEKLRIEKDERTSTALMLLTIFMSPFILIMAIAFIGYLQGKDVNDTLSFLAPPEAMSEIPEIKNE